MPLYNTFAELEITTKIWLDNLSDHNKFVLPFPDFDLTLKLDIKKYSTEVEEHLFIQ